MNNLPPLTERIDQGAPGGHEFERLLNQLLILYANPQDFDYEPMGRAGGDDGLDGLARRGGLPGYDGPVGFQAKWLWGEIHKGSKAAQATDSLKRAGAADIQERDLVATLLKIAEPDMKQGRVLEYVRDRAGLRLNRAEGIYSLPHRTFQEYLAARHLTLARFPD